MTRPIEIPSGPNELVPAESNQGSVASPSNDSESDLVGVRRVAPLTAPTGTPIDSINALVGAFDGPAGESVDEVVYR